MYYIDTLAGGVDVFDFELESGEISNRRRLASFTPEDGIPDGLAVDSDDDLIAGRRVGAAAGRDEDVVGVVAVGDDGLLEPSGGRPAAVAAAAAEQRAEHSTTAQAPSVIGGQSCLRSGATNSGSANSASGWSSPVRWAWGFDIPARRLAATTAAISASVNVPASSPARACNAATETESSHSGPSV